MTEGSLINLGNFVWSIADMNPGLRGRNLTRAFAVENAVLYNHTTQHKIAETFSENVELQTKLVELLGQLVRPPSPAKPDRPAIIGHVSTRTMNV